MDTTPSKKRKKLKSLIWIAAAIGIAGMALCSVAFGGQKKLPVYYVDTSEKKVAISFDAAWGNEYTAGILDILDTYDVKATFFLVDFWAEKYPDDVKMIAERGHDIGNHSTTHPDMADMSVEQIRQELNTTADTIEEITGKRPVLFRPPFGSYSDRLIECAEELGYTTIQWDVEGYVTEEKIIKIYMYTNKNCIFFKLICML